MVIIRVGLTTRTNQTTRVPLGNTSMDNGLSTELWRGMQVHITTLTESKVDHDRRI